MRVRSVSQTGKTLRAMGIYLCVWIWDNYFESGRGERDGKDKTIEVCGLLLFIQSQHAIQGNVFLQNKKK